MYFSAGGWKVVSKNGDRDKGSGAGVSMTRACLLPRDGLHSTNWFVHSAEEASSRPNWFGKQVSAFPLKSDDFRSLRQCQHFVTPVTEVTVGLHFTAPQLTNSACLL